MLASTPTIEHLIGGDRVAAASGLTFENLDPHDGALIANIARGGDEDASRAVTAARTAFDEGPWPRMSSAERRRLLHAFADLVDERTLELADLDVRDMGKPIREAAGMDVPRVSRNLRFFADYADLAASEAYPGAELLSYVIHAPAGVVVAIAPWNFPAMQASWKAAPALAFGNTVVLKPAEQSPLSASCLGELALEAGLPEGVLNVVHGLGEEVGAALTRDPRVDRITFTGETATGRVIMAAVAENLTPVSFELGGRSANVVFADCDLDEAVAGAIRAIFTNNGEVCLAGSRLLVQRPILDAFSERFVAATQALRVGDPKDPATAMGPLVDRAQVEKVHRYVGLGIEEGGELLCGGDRPPDQDLPARGNYYAPTVLTDMRNDMRSVREEIFGPVQTIVPFDTETTALAIANDSPYGLAGMLWTNDLDRAHRMANAWRTGMVWVNCFFERDLRLPFGGERSSGIGREGGKYSREFFTEPRAVTIKRGLASDDR